MVIIIIAVIALHICNIIAWTKTRDPHDEEDFTFSTTYDVRFSESTSSNVDTSKSVTKGTYTLSATADECAAPTLEGKVFATSLVDDLRTSTLEENISMLNMDDYSSTIVDKEDLTEDDVAIASSSNESSILEDKFIERSELDPEFDPELNYELTPEDETAILIDSCESKLGQSDFFWLCAITQAEAGNSEFEAQVAIAAEVLNRVESSEFPNTIYEVLMRPGQYYDGVPQITGSDGQKRNITPLDITDSVKEAVAQAYFGEDPTNGAYFHVTPTATTPETLAKFYELYGEPCYTIGTLEFFTKDYDSES